IDPIAQAGKLGALLLQFPWSFRNIEGNRRWLSKLAKDFAPYPLVVELRHASWLREAAFRFLESLSLAFCNIDQPEMRDSIGPSSRVTAGVGYVRFHGRNREAWFRKDAGRDERYNYLYSTEELNAWVPRIHEIAGRAERTFVIGNNHFKGQAPANILQIKKLVQGGEVKAPPSLLEAFPLLKACLE
ncbi:MAG: DUF72 domain-containing protein, partial [Planctomycetota bacterium]